MAEGGRGVSDVSWVTHGPGDESRVRHGPPTPGREHHTTPTTGRDLTPPQGVLRLPGSCSLVIGPGPYLVDGPPTDEFVNGGRLERGVFRTRIQGAGDLWE